MPVSKKFSRTDFLVEIGTRIKDLREKIGMNQEELAFLAGVHRTYVGAVERGEQNLTLMTMKRFMDALGASLEEFFTGFTQKQASKLEEMRTLRESYKYKKN